MIEKVHLVYFSPSGSTEKAVRKIVSAIEGLPVEKIDLLTSAARKKSCNFGPSDLVIMGSMTAGKLFTLSEELFACLHADNTPFIGAVTFGNTYYGIALKEMLARAKAQGFRIAALGAFVCRHSMDTRIASERPDANDQEIMLEFGRNAWQKVQSGDYELHTQPTTSWTDWEMGRQVVAYREAHPEEPYALPRDCKAKAISDACIKCMTCVRHYPVDAIDIEHKAFDIDKCIGCWGCINRCPKHAITSTSEQVKQIMASIGEATTARLEPELFF